MRTISVHLPDMLELNDTEILMIIASKLYEQGKLSLGQAAHLANLSKRTFLEALANYGVSAFNYSEVDFEKDVNNVKDYYC
jgi:predicted HTH domain antitoxin